jgi:hypothetical protein
MVHYRFIVARDQEKLFDHLVRSLADMEDIEVILDRRQEPFRERARGSAERRLHVRIQDDLHIFGWSFVRVTE